jgi:hypothetical protein
MKITKNPLLLLLISFYADNKPATPLLVLQQSDQESSPKNTEFGRLVYLLKANLERKKDHIRKEGQLRDRVLNEMILLTEGLIKAFQREDFCALLEKHNEHNRAQKILKLFLKQSAELDQALVTTKGFLGHRSDASIRLINNHIRDLKTLQLDLYEQAKKVISKENKDKATINKKACDCVTAWGEKIKHTRFLDRPLIREIEEYRDHILVDEATKNALRDMLQYINDNFTLHYDTRYQKDEDGHYCWTNKSYYL